MTVEDISIVRDKFFYDKLDLADLSISLIRGIVQGFFLADNFHQVG